MNGLHSGMQFRKFETYGALERDALALLQEHMGLEATEPHAVVLTGGTTPLGLYDHIRRRPFRVDPSLHIIVSDERYVSVELPESNLGRMRPMLDALAIADARLLRVRTELPLETAAERYHHDLSVFLASGRITLAMLGIGADGHVASLFAAEDLNAGAGRFAVAVHRPDGPHRVSVTRDLLLRADRIVFLVTGRSKAELVDAMRADPGKLIAGQVVRDAAWVELWHTREDRDSPRVL